MEQDSSSTFNRTGGLEGIGGPYAGHPHPALWADVPSVFTRVYKSMHPHRLVGGMWFALLGGG